jgi:hypothetical protein
MIDIATFIPKVGAIDREKRVEVEEVIAPTVETY